MADSTFSKPQIIPYCEVSTENVTLFDCKWVPSSVRIVVLGSHVKGHGTIQIYSMTKDAKLNLSTQVKRPDPIKCGTFGATSLEDRYVSKNFLVQHKKICMYCNCNCARITLHTYHECFISNNLKICMIGFFKFQMVNS